MDKNTTRMGAVALVVGFGLVVGCASTGSSEPSVGANASPLSGATATDLTFTQVAAFNPSIAAGECTGPNSTIVKCWMTTYVNATQASGVPGIVIGKRIGTGAWALQQATSLNLGVPSTPFYDGTAVTGYSTDASISYIRRDTFALVTIVDSNDARAKGAILSFTTNAGTTWSTPKWVHSGCSTLGPRSVAFWNARSLKIQPNGRVLNPDGTPYDPYLVVASVGHEQCCPPGVICGGFIPEEVEFGGAYVDGQFYDPWPAQKYTTVNDGFVREQSRYLNFDVVNQVSGSHKDAQGIWRVDLGNLYVFATLPTTEDGNGTTPATGLNASCPSTATVDVRWRSKTLDVNIGNWSPSWVAGPIVDSVKGSRLCFGTTKRTNSWLPALGHTQDNKLIQFAIGAPTVKGQRIQATELDTSLWPPTVVPGHYLAADPPALARNSEQYMPTLAYFLTGNIQQIALTWVDDRGGASDGAFGALLGVGNVGDERISNLAATPTTLVAHATFNNTNVSPELQATHIGAAADISPQNSGFAGTTWKGNRTTFVNFQP